MYTGNFLRYSMKSAVLYAGFKIYVHTYIICCQLMNTGRQWGHAPISHKCCTPSIFLLLSVIFLVMFETFVLLKN
jgi:hypothetical protein